VSTDGAWQIAATGVPASKKALTKATASLSARTTSPLITPPGRTSPAKVFGSASASVRSTVLVPPLSMWS
jgi:hypothetical protein